MTERPMTQHLLKVYYAILNNIGLYGLRGDDKDKLNAALTSTEKRSTHESKLGAFTLRRFVSVKGDHGFRVHAVSGSPSPELAKALLKANHELESLDTEYPEAVWAEVPFWAVGTR